MQDSIEAFRASFSGQTFTSGHPDYDLSRAVWNGAIDRKPALIASCTTAEQVADAIRFGRVSGLQIAIRGGGHNYAGHAVCDDGLMIHLGAMNGVAVDPEARRAAAAQPGPTSTRRRSSMGSRRPAASSAIPALRDSRSEEESAGSPRRPGSPATTCLPRKW